MKKVLITPLLLLSMCFSITTVFAQKTDTIQSSVEHENIVQSDSVKTQNKNKHFVIKKHKHKNKISKVNDETSKISEPANINQSSNNNVIILFSLILLSILSYIIYYRFYKKCTKCKKWYAMKNINTKCIDQKPTTIVEVRKTWNNKDEIVKKREVDVPATKYHYRTFRKCKYCGHEDFIDSYKTRKN